MGGIRESSGSMDWVHAKFEVGGGEIREEKGENSLTQRGKRWRCSTKSGVELFLSLVGAWGGVEVSLERYLDRLRSV